MGLRCMLVTACIAWLQAGLPDAGENQPIKPLPREISVAGKTYRVVPGVIPSPALPKGWRSVDPARLAIDKETTYWLMGSTYLRTPEGGFLLPWEGSAPFVSWIASGSGRVWPLHPDLPPTGEMKNDTSSPGPARYQWTGWLDNRQDPPQRLWLFIRRWDREQQRFSTMRADIPPTAPDKTRVEPAGPWAVEKVISQSKDEILCQIIDENTETWARVSLDSWQILAMGEKAPENCGHLGTITVSPGRGDIYVTYSSGGLVIYDANDGKVLAHHPEAGHYFNAHTLGATFDADGTIAAVSTPYGHKITLLDTKTRKILAEYTTETPLAGLIFRKEEVAACGTFLPYE